ncbi:unnamed protein product [Diamesa serratosioi]
MVLTCLNVIVDCKLDMFQLSEKLDNNLESHRFPTLPPWFPTGIPTGFPTGYPTRSTTPVAEQDNKDQEIDEKEDKDKDDVIIEKQEPEAEIEDSGNCPEEGLKVMKHESQCGKYIICFGGVRIVRNCSPGLHWSLELQSCTRPEFSECEEDACPTTNDPENLVFLPDLEDCSKYYLCFDGKPVLFNCAEGFHWNSEHELCMEKDEAMCTYESEPIDTFVCPMNTGTSYYPHESKCGSFYQCVNGIPGMLNCADGLLWIFSDGSGLNLEKLIKTDGAYLEAQNLGFQYFYSPCHNSKKVPIVSNTTTDNCSGGTGYSLCQYNNATHVLSNLGNESEISFTKYDGNVVMLFTVSDLSVSTITLVCTPNDTSTILYVPFGTDQKNLTLYSSHACITTPVDESHGFFYILFVIFITFVFAYLSIGMLVRYFLIGARGFEVIPNLDLWMKIKNTLWLGFIYVKNGCRVIPADNTYDSI